jgi:Ca2+-binding EF-hand superfamily protein
MEHLSMEQRATLRKVFASCCTTRGDSLQPTIASRELHRILVACGVRGTEADAHSLILRADSSGRGFLSEPDFLQLMTGALSDTHPDVEIEALFADVSSGTETVSAASIAAFVDEMRSIPGVDVPRFTAAELASAVADASSADTPAALTRHDFRELLNLQLPERQARR